MGFCALAVRTKPRRRLAVLLSEPFHPVTSPSEMERPGFVYVIANDPRALD